MAVRTGEQFLEGLRDGREIWLEGERVGDVTTHPKMARMAQTLAGIYDLQHSPENHEKMTFNSPTNGEPVALSYLVPETPRTSYAAGAPWRSSPSPVTACWAARPVM
ncbi:MAG: hypothetical protein IIA92_11660 [Chloroflexi bacterium]|nr:hypothetical protein [Chloroflexota bacterium]